MGQLKVFILSEHELVRRGLRAMLEGIEDIDVPLDTEQLEELLVYLRGTPGGLVLVHGPSSTLVSQCIAMKSASPDAAIIAVGGAQSAQALTDLLTAGVTGRVSEGATQGELLDTLRTVARGRVVLDQEDVRQAIGRIAHPSGSKPRQARHNLSEREVQVLSGLVAGKSTKEMAYELILSESTVKTYVGRLLDKLRVANRLEAVALAVRDGLAIGPRGPVATVCREERDDSYAHSR